ncbi:FAD binding domain-containing protein [Actinacidiphila oryziradicis]|uniref:FAD binding domain-containing protein n=1 Tax=Actinacidiphila oryziradicis TaxID=2571141 RepID=UPI0023F1B0CA|nr:FAD binding domain-containing protein [Actinacidiphila oryziradicis]MCW2869725.1 molybdopterin dehydrogenase FAD-binding protein [Actinacidiphila oryziradicis]
MKPAPFDYARPRHLAELFGTLVDGDVLLAGGQSLLPELNERKRSPRRLVDINGIGGLQRLDVRPDTVVLGALTRHQTLADSPEVRAAVPVLSCAAARVGHAAVRTRGTLGGSIANADPAAELPGIGVLLGASAQLRSPDSSRTVGVGELLHPRAIGEQEVIVAIELPRMTGRDGWGFREVSRPGAYAFPLVTVAATLRLAVDGTVSALRAAVTGAAPVPYALGDAAGELIGRRPDQEWFGAVADLLVGRADPVTDLYASAAYRRRLIRHLTHGVLADALQRAREAMS